MHELEDLKEMLCKELKKYGGKNDLTAGSLEVVDKLTHTIKNLDKIIENYDGEYSGDYRGREPYAYARGRMNTRRDARGRYSSEGYSREYSREGYSRTGDIIEQLEGLMDDAPDERTKMEIRKLINKMENMR